MNVFYLKRLVGYEQKEFSHKIRSTRFQSSMSFVQDLNLVKIFK